MSLRIHDSLTRTLAPFAPLAPDHVRMYVCGITIYDYCHVGHARFLVAFDIVARWLRTLGYRVTYVRNITDIDDKIIRRALERGIAIRALTQEMTQAMHEDTARIGVLAPTFEPRATEHVAGMLELIATLEARGLAYRAADGDVNFAVRKFPGYGKLSGKSLDQLRAGERVAVLGAKQDPLDFVLWKAAKESEPEDAKWDSPFGRGRPGWHIECSAMCQALLGEEFDIHGGGMDLTFPHHENEIAQSEGAGQRFARIWMHNGLLELDNEKMSKSLGNFFTIRDVLERFDGETLRFFFLRAHYRSALAYSEASLVDARGALRRLYTALDGVALPAADTALDWAEPRAVAFRAAMNEDFATPEAVAVLFELAGELNRTRSAQVAALLKGLGATLGILQQAPRAFLQGGAAAIDEPAIAARIAERAAAKHARDFARADAIRAELAAEGIELKDSAQGTIWVRS